MLPAFGDGHVHPLWGGVELAGPPVRDGTSVAEVVEAVRAVRRARTRTSTGCRAARTTPRWSPAAGSTRPGWTPPSRTGRWSSQSTDHHCAWVNTEALRRAGIDAGTPDPPTGEVARRAGRHPARDARRVDRDGPGAAPRPAGHRRRADRRAGAGPAALLAAAGVTWVQEAALSPDGRRRLPGAAAADRLAVRANIALRAEPGPVAGAAGRVRRGPARGRRVAGRRAGVGPDREDVRRRGRRGGHGGDAVAVRRSRRTPAACRSGRPTSSPRLPWPSTPTASSCTSTPSVTPACAPPWTRSSRWRPSTGRATGGR